MKTVWNNLIPLAISWTLLLCCPSLTSAVLNWEIQRYDGWYNNLAHHSRGTVGAPFVRLLPANYADGVLEAIQEPGLPNPRSISNVAMQGMSGIPCDRNRTVLFVYFGFHVIDEIVEGTGSGCPAEFLNIQVPSGDPVFDPNSTGSVQLPFQRSQWATSSGQSPNNPRLQINHATTWIDGSSIYGSSHSWSDALRTFSDGLLASGSDKLLPRQGTGLIRLWKTADPATKQHGIQGLFDFGNARANESPFLQAESIIWFRYHNYLAAQLKAQNPTWTDEDLFQNARKRVIATFQRIIFYEWLPAFIGQNVSRYGGYKKQVDPGISPEFQSAAIRIINSLVPSGVYMRTKACLFRNVTNVNREDRAFRMCNNFWSRENPNLKGPQDIDDVILGMASQIAEREDNVVVSDLRDFMYGPLRFTRSDVVALDIQRGRDSGLPSYNQARQIFDLQPITNWSSLNTRLHSEKPELFDQLAALYKNDISKLEMLVGGFLESDGDTERLFPILIRDQFERIRDGDRFWFENTKNGLFAPTELEAIWNTKYADVLLATTSAGPQDIQRHVFFWEDGDPCAQPKQLNDSDLEPCVKVSTMHYFQGSGAGFGILIVALCCLPLAALLMAFTVAGVRKKEKSQLQKKRVSVRTPTDSGNKIRAFEWQGPKEPNRPVSIILDSDKCLKAMDSKGALIRSINLCNVGHADIIQSTNNEQKALLLKVPKEYDLVLMFNGEEDRNNFVEDLKAYLERHGINLLIHEVKERTLLKEAVTKQQRIKILDTFFRRVFAQVLEIDGSDAGDFDNEISKKAKESLKCELTSAEFADALGLKESSMFVEQMFSLADKDGNGYLSFREFLDIFIVLMKGSPEEKSKLMFAMYDVDGSGSMSKEEFSQLLRSFIEIANNCLPKEQIQDVIESMFKDAGFEDKEELMWEDFHYLFRDHYHELELAQLNVKGIEGQKRGRANQVSFVIKKKDEVPKSAESQPETSPKETSPSETSSPEHFVLDLRKRFGKKSSQTTGKVFTEPKRDKYTKNKLQQKYHECRQYTQNHQRQIFCSIIFFGITAGVFVERAYYYAVLREHSGVPQTTRVGLIIARGSAAAVSFLYSYILLTMCRNLITVLRETFLNLYIPFDSAVDFHRWVAMAAAFFSVLHSAAHAVNIYTLSASPLSVLACLFPEAVHDDGSELPLKYYWWFFQNITGMAGVLLLFAFSILHVFALHYFRRISFRAFWMSHHLYIAIYILIILHGSAALLQPQRFHVYLIIPALIFIGDKFVSYSRKKIEIAVVKAELLPSGVTHLEFKRPKDFDYKSGQWVRIASLILGTNEYHPFTLTSAPHEDTLSLHIRAVGPWTIRLREIYSRESILALGRNPKIYLDGPFGEGHQEWNKFEVSVLVGGGIGVTPFASILKDLVFKSTINSKILCKKIYFIWVTRTQRQFEWLEDIIREVEETDKNSLVSVHIYITQLAEKFDLRTTMLYICERHFQKVSNRSLFTGLRSITHFGRPQFFPFFNSLVEVHPEVTKIGVFSCGPPGMTTNVEKACKQMNKRHTIQFHHHYENF
ncbi:dual oxidase 1-like isoform X1 [Carcharodon carcharias]|uniref:dual oxidase 1-like isoform X1 n=1 Tax=Carcharodon carcharias TaxID=13397 RepID=UPI001B7ECCE1|nr:dual oxidase 1-like isoform X1 [Carcharodon carcharias]XP_041034594.1 dual oxidase 1-like isoform X1 [Carcharodon carcharias]